MRRLQPFQAIETAMKASKNINTAPTRGRTIGMADTTASTGSVSWAGVWGVGVDMVIPSVCQIRNKPDFTHAGANRFIDWLDTWQWWRIYVSMTPVSAVNSTMNPSIRLPLLAALLATVIGTLAACAATGPSSPSARPVLYPNATLNRVGEARGRAEAEACMARAQSAGLTPDEQNNETARRAGQGAATGGVAAAVGALVTGRGVDGAVRSGAAGAAVGGSAGAVSGAMRQKASSTYRYFVQRCMSEKGFEVIGWN